MPVWSCTIPVVLPSKGNSHKIIRKGGFAQIGHKAETNSAMKTAITFLRAQAPPVPFMPDDELFLSAWFTVADFRSDPTCELLKDCIEKSGIIDNDNQIRRVYYETLPEKGEPSTLIRLETVGKLQWKNIQRRKPKSP